MNKALPGVRGKVVANVSVKASRIDLLISLFAGGGGVPFAGGIIVPLNVVEIVGVGLEVFVKVCMIAVVVAPTVLNMVVPACSCWPTANCRVLHARIPSYHV